LLGYVLAGHAAHAREAWLLGIGVDPEARGLGYGRLLLEHGLARLQADGARAVRMTVRPDNTTAIGLYRSLGFTTIGHQSDYYGPGEDRDEMALRWEDRPPSGAFGDGGAHGGAG
jgi:ribosomal-protein-alanine N-acetyltransferase